jgi:hypothetical protein
VNGPEHYAEGERVLAVAEGLDWQTPDGMDGSFARLCIEAAQAHFAAAQVAATMDVAGASVNGVVTTGWADAIKAQQ